MSALAGGSALYAWCRMQEEERQRGWRLYGWFSALMLCGSCFGAVSWAARMTQLENVFNGNDLFSNGNRAQGTALQAVAHSWRAVFAVTYAIEFLCLSTAKLMVLDRMSDFAAPREDGLRRRWVVGGRVVMAVVVLGNAVGLAASAAAAVHSQRAAEAASTSSALFAANNTQAVWQPPSSTSESAKNRSNLLVPFCPCSRSARLLCCCSLWPRLLQSECCALAA